MRSRFSLCLRILCIQILLSLPVLLWGALAKAQPCTDGVCVPPEDLKAFVTLAREAKCRNETLPTLTMDPIAIVVDKDQRIYGSGSNPRPFKVKLLWCNYTIDAPGTVQIYAAQHVEPSSGFRFRPKATVGYLPVTAFGKRDGYAGLDAGVLLEPVFLQWANLDAYIGFRAVGAGVGFDLTRNLGLYLGYAITWGSWQSNPHVALSFALW